MFSSTLLTERNGEPYYAGPMAPALNAVALHREVRTDYRVPERVWTTEFVWEVAGRSILVIGKGRSEEESMRYALGGAFWSAGESELRRDLGLGASLSDRLAAAAAVLLIAGSIMLAFVLITEQRADAQPRKSWAPCAYEDGPGPCVWHAPSRGNGEGHSFFIRKTGETVYVTDSRARKMLAR